MRRHRALAALLAVAVAVPAAPAALQRPAAAYPTDHLELAGHGWGHGRGMGQYGAFGYARDHGWSSARILDHFYRGTRAGTASEDRAANPRVAIELGRERGQATWVTAASGVVRVAGTVHAAPAWQAVRTGASTWDLYPGSSCADVATKPGSTPPALRVTSPPTFSPQSDTAASPGAAAADLLRSCRTSKRYRGDVQANEHLGGAITLNLLPVEAYLWGVVPIESISSWPAAALEAQAVAARSYGLSRDLAGPATGCDLGCGTSYQAYDGYDREASSTTTAVSRTAGVVRRFTSNGALAATEYSSSTGGYTAGGTFPAVEDAGDVTSPRHSWSARVPVSAIQERYGMGTLQSVVITSRQGCPCEWGGRVLRMELRFSGGTQVLTGQQLRDAFSSYGVHSSWFTVVGRQPGTPTAATRGYWVEGADGGIFPYGGAGGYGSTGGMRLNQPIVGMAATATGRGYWLVATDGGIFPFGDAGGYGSTGGIRLNQPIVGMAATRTGRGYWLAASDGGIFPFGDAVGHGSLGGTRLNQPVVGIAGDPSSGGYWLVARDGGIFPFGGARGIGSLGAMRLNQPIVGMAPTATGQGYWLLGGDGGIFPFGDAAGVGSLPGRGVVATATSMVGSATGRGYLIGTSDGRVHEFGDAVWLGDPASAITGYAGGLRGLARFDG